MEKNMYKIILVLSMSVLMTHSINAAQTIDPNIKHDWEDSRYTVNGDGTILDKKTNLIWKQCTQGLSGATCATGTATTHNWQQALDLAEISTFAGFSDWRVPNIKELSSLVAYDRYGPAINIAIFPNTPTQASYFWSSSPLNLDLAWLILTTDGRRSRNVRNENHYVRLVRGGE